MKFAPLIYASAAVGLSTLGLNLFYHPAQTIPVVVALCVAGVALKTLYARRQLRLRAIKIKDLRAIKTKQ